MTPLKTDTQNVEIVLGMYDALRITISKKHEKKPMSGEKKNKKNKKERMNLRSSLLSDPRP